MDITQSAIDSILRQEDIEGLIESGAPGDEYSSEAENIASALAGFTREQLTEDNIVEVLSSVWSRNFNLAQADIGQRLPAIRRVAAQIIYFC